MQKACPIKQEHAVSVVRDEPQSHNLVFRAKY